MNAGFIRDRLVRYLDWYGTTLIPEFSMDGWRDRADLIQITRQGLAVEYEIKTNYEDWRDDRKKPKWAAHAATGSQHVSRFYYVTPGRAVDAPGGGTRRWESTVRVPEKVAPGAGLIIVTDEGLVREVAPARRFKVPPIPDAVVRRAKDAFYYRYWRMHWDHQHALEELAEIRRRWAYPNHLGAP